MADVMGYDGVSQNHEPRIYWIGHESRFQNLLMCPLPNYAFTPIYGFL